MNDVDYPRTWTMLRKVRDPWPGTSPRIDHHQSSSSFLISAQQVSLTSAALTDI